MHCGGSRQFEYTCFQLFLRNTYFMLRSIYGAERERVERIPQLKRIPMKIWRF
jgi:hypothetical protein